MNSLARLIAFYLPQYHPTPENDAWWGKGFTEWTNVAKAKPLFKGHYQPHLPSDLGFYDLRIPEVREAQAELARNAGIEAFCYYHYWFGGKRLLERPFAEVVASGKPDFPFCLCWANQTWSGIWHGAPDRILMEQTYPGCEDHRNHFFTLLPAFQDRRYLRIDNRPVFVIYRPEEVPNVTRVIQQWQEMAVQNGLPGLHIVAHLFHDEANWDYKSHGFHSSVVVSNRKVFKLSAREMFLGPRNGHQHANLNVEEFREWLWRRTRRALGQFNQIRLYKHALPYFLDDCRSEPGVFPCITPGWDNTPRSGVGGCALHDSTPGLFREHVRDALALVKSHPEDQRLVFIKSWNEWAEGNYLEPDQKYGHDYLNVIRDEVSRGSSFAT